MPNKKNSKKIQARAAVKLASRNANAVADSRAMKRPESSRFSLYIYWFIILFFVAATCYILGRGYSITHKMRGANISESYSVNMDGLSTEERARMSEEYLKSGQVKLLSGDHIGAIADLTISIDAAPSAIAFLYRGESFMQGAEYSNALADFTNAIKMDPENAIAYYDGALVSMRLEKFDEARAALDIALDLYKRRPTEVLSLRDIYSKRAQVNLWTKDWEAAAADYTNAIGAGDSPNYADFAGRAEAFTAMGQYLDAANDYMSAVTIIAAVIQGEESSDVRETMSRDAMTYFEKAAALHVALGDAASASINLDAALTLAVSLNDAETAARLRGLIEKM